MRSVLFVVCLLVAGVGCGKQAEPTRPVILGLPAPSAPGTVAEARGAPAAATAAPARMDPGRDYASERESFERVARSGRADPGEIHELLGVAPDFQFSFETMAGDTMAGAEYRLKGPRSGAPFFEAFPDEHGANSFYVFYERGWVTTRAVDCGFQPSGMYRTRTADD
jgi:hypothetical protein